MYRRLSNHHASAAATTLAMAMTLATGLSGCVIEEFAIGQTFQAGTCKTCNLEEANQVAHLDHLDDLTKAALTNGDGTLNTGSTGGMETYADGQDTLKHAVACALPDGATVTYTDRYGQVITWEGAHGIAPCWACRPIDPDTEATDDNVTCSTTGDDDDGGIDSTPDGDADTSCPSIDEHQIDAIGRCLLAYVNDDDTVVALLTGNNDERYGYGPDFEDGKEADDYAVMSGVYYGHGLGPQGGEAHFWSCATLPQELQRALGDQGADPLNGDGATDSRECSYPNADCGIHSVGYCGEVCDTYSGYQQGWGDCIAGEPNVDGVDTTKDPTWVYLLQDTHVDFHACDGNSSSCEFSSDMSTDGRMIVKVTDSFSPGSSSLFCTGASHCAFYIDGANRNYLSASNGAQMATFATDHITGLCTDFTTSCNLTVPTGSNAIYFACQDGAECRMTCLDGDMNNCKFNTCDDGGDTAGTQCKGYDRVRFCGQQCPGTCSTELGNSCGYTVDAVPGVSMACSCTDDCLETGDCCEDKYRVCGASLPINKPWGHWTFDDHLHNIVTDDDPDDDPNVNAHELDATLHGASYQPDVPALVGSPNTHSLYFDGVDDYATIPHHDNIDFGSGEDFTVAVWIKPDADQPTAQDSGIIVSKETGNPYTSYSIVYNHENGASKIKALRKEDGVQLSFSATSTIPTDEFTLVAFVKERDDLHLYINGVNEKTITDLTSNPSNDADVTLGRLGHTAKHYFKGFMDDLHIYERALSEDEIQYMWSSCYPDANQDCPSP